MSLRQYVVKWPDGDTFTDADGQTAFTRERAELIAQQTGGQVVPAAVADPAGTLGQLGARLSPDFDAYASGQLPADRIRCVLCEHAPCDCPPFGTPEYFALVDRLHEKQQ
jgi:hypothetical protein